MEGAGISGNAVLGSVGAIAAWAAFSTANSGLVGLGLLAFAGIDGFLIAKTLQQSLSVAG